MFKKIGKVLLVKPALISEEEREFYKELSFENFIFFKEHFEGDFEEYLSHLRGGLRSIKFLAVDQEGGRVCRIKGDFASPSEIAEKAKFEGERVLIDWAEKIAETLENYKLNLNLSPVVDRGNKETPQFLKGRTFSKDPEEIVKFAEILIGEHKKRGLRTCLKHFPGLYNVKIDPHKELPVKEKLFDEDLYPFIKLSSRADFIMTTHLFLPELDMEKPSTFSERLISFLRKITDFKGAILTDDLSMGALKSYSLSERIVLSLVSGHNILIFCGSFEDLMESLFEIKGEIERSKILKEKSRSP